MYTEENSRHPGTSPPRLARAAIVELRFVFVDSTAKLRESLTRCT